MKEIARIVILVIVLVVLLGLAYPLFTALVARIDGKTADGDIVYRNGRPVGAKSIGQRFYSTGFFHGRPSAAGRGYDAMKSGASNVGPSNPRLIKDAKAQIAKFLKENPGVKVGDIPVEMVTASASGLDPEINVESATLQVQRLSSATGIDESKLKELIHAHTIGRTLGIFGEPRVNVLELNLAVLKLSKEAGR